jgi:hypothetical protein
MNLKESAKGIFRTLQSDPVFEHFGKDSRSVNLSTASVAYDLNALANDTIDPYGKQFITFASWMITHFFDQGITVRIKNKYNIELRGADFSIPDESNLEVTATSRFRTENKIQIDVSKDNTSLWVQLYTERSNNDTLENRINTEIIDQIPEHAKEALIKGVLDIVARQVNQIENG